ncbi:MAG: hypothetical protein HYW95_03370 [Candidatus Wildermuthbacteria bacterium]|nr:hypothetical protein [Candidatus Wildermuthbacteria bacterium]
MFSYEKICSQLLSDTHPRTKDILTKRFGLYSEEPQTLEAIGKSHGITRERVRQIVEDGIALLKEKALRNRKENPEVQEVLRYFADALRKLGYVKKEDLFIEYLEAKPLSCEVIFLMHLEDRFARHRETEDFYPFWSAKREYVDQAPAIHQTVIDYLKEHSAILSDEEIKEELLAKIENQLHHRTFFSLLESSKHIMQAYDGKWGLRQWPEVNPRGMREKAYIVLRNAGKPLHFLQITEHIDHLQKLLPSRPERAVLSQTVHNELIKDPRFVLVGRGIYALKDWGYESGTVRDVLVAILEQADEHLSREELIQKTLEQRQVRESTILLNLQDRDQFARDEQGRYYLVHI